MKLISVNLRDWLIALGKNSLMNELLNAIRLSHHITLLDILVCTDYTVYIQCLCTYVNTYFQFYHLNTYLITNNNRKKQ